jgi:hypothetical protein
LAALLEMAGLPVPAGSELGVVDLALHVAGESGRYRVSELAGALGPARLAGGFDLALDGTGPAISSLDVAIDATYSDAGQLAGFAGLIEPPPAGLGGLDLKARLNGGPSQARLEEIQANIGPVRLAGALGLDLAGLTPALASYDVSVTAKHPDLAGLASALGWDAGLAESFGGIDLTARLHGDLGRMQVEGLSGNLGPVDLSGRLSADFAGERPNFVADLETGDVPLDQVLGRAIDPASLRDFDARLDLEAAALTHHALRVERVGLSASLMAGLLELEGFSGLFHGGALQLDGKAELREESVAELAITAIEVDLGDFLRTHAGIDGIVGPVYFNGDFTARGTSAGDLVSGLAGEAEVSGLLTFEGQPGTDTETDAGSGTVGLQDMSDLGEFLARTLGRDSVRLAGTFTAAAGQLQTENTRLDGQPAYALTLAKFDLPGWTLDGVTDIYERSAGRPLISSIAYGGPLDDLQVESLQTPSDPAPEPKEAQPEPEAEEQPAPAVEEEPVPIVQEPAAQEVEELAAPAGGAGGRGAGRAGGRGRARAAGLRNRRARRDSRAGATGARAAAGQSGGAPAGRGRPAEGPAQARRLVHNSTSIEMPLCLFSQ